MSESNEKNREDIRVELVTRYRELILDNNRMSKSHMRVFDHWLPRIGAPMAYEMARVAYSDDKRYQMLKGRHSHQ